MNSQDPGQESPKSRKPSKGNTLPTAPGHSRPREGLREAGETPLYLDLRARGLSLSSLTYEIPPHVCFLTSYISPYSERSSVIAPYFLWSKAKRTKKPNWNSDLSREPLKERREMWRLHRHTHTTHALSSVLCKWPSFLSLPGGLLFILQDPA